MANRELSEVNVSFSQERSPLSPGSYANETVSLAIVQQISTHISDYSVIFLLKTCLGTKAALTNFQLR